MTFTHQPGLAELVFLVSSACGARVDYSGTASRQRLPEINYNTYIHKSIRKC